jgi:acetyl-CoA C-acetyltransferase
MEELSMEKVVIVSAKRTAIGAFGGTLKDIVPAELARSVLESILMNINIDKEYIEEVILGCILQAGHGQNIARQTALNTGLPIKTVATTINQVCGSGLSSVILACRGIASGDISIAAAGGTENMSLSPYIAEGIRWGVKMNDIKLRDSMMSDALTDSFHAIHMGITAENIAEKYGISRQEQDRFALYSQQKAQKAIKEGRFKDEIAPVELPKKKDCPLFEIDEFPRFNTTIEGLAKLRPAFKKDGTVTAGNSSGINDGAAMVLVMSKTKASELGVKPLAQIVSYAAIGVDPKIMGIGPVYSTKLALKKAGMDIKDIGLIEANEAFAAQSIAVMREAGFREDITNVNGGAIALGHPVGASGARILTTLLHEMKRRNVEFGLATLCVGGGMGVSLIIQNI